EESLVQASVPDASLGRVTSCLRVIGWAAMLLGTIVGGILGETVGPRAAMLIGGIGMLPALLLLLWAPVRGLRALPATSPPDPPPRGPPPPPPPSGAREGQKGAQPSGRGRPGGPRALRRLRHQCRPSQPDRRQRPQDQHRAGRVQHREPPALEHDPAERAAER